MSRRMLAILGLGAIVAVLLALVLAHQSEDASVAAGDEPLLPALADRVNDIESLEIVAPDGETVASLHRERERWRMREKHDYEADFARIHDLLRDLASARRQEAKTDNSEWYGRLGVATPGGGDNSGVVVRFPESEIPAVIIGKRDSAGIGRYVRREDEARAWLVGQDLSLPIERMEWLELAIMDIPAADIRSVTVRHPDGQTVELRPGDAEGSTWVMLDPPSEREVKPAWQLRQTASVLAKLNMEDVRPHESASVPEDAVETIFRTRDGMVFHATTFSDDAGRWVHFRVSEGESAGPDAETGEGAPPVDASGDDSAATDFEIDIVAVDGRLSPWQFAVDDDRFERLRPGVEDLLVAPEEAGEEAGSQPRASIDSGRGE